MHRVDNFKVIIRFCQHFERQTDIFERLSEVLTPMGSYQDQLTIPKFAEQLFHFLCRLFFGHLF